MLSPRNIRFALALLVTATIVGMVIAISLKGFRPTSPGPVSQQLPQNIDVALQNARFTETRDGVTVWELVAKRVEYDKTGETAFLEDIHMVYLKSGTSGSITLTAAKGEYSNISKNIRLRGKVHVVTDSGMVFDTDSLDYLAESSLFRTDDHVNFYHERLSLSATGMELYAKTETSRFFKPVDAVVKGVQPH
jgi:LPS export ABC transporter protein LptC